MGLSHPLEDLFCCCCCCGCNHISNHWGLQTLEDLFCCWWFLFSRNNQHWKTYLCCCVLQHHFTRFRAGKSCCEEWLKILRYKHPLTKMLGLESIFWKGLFSVVFSLFYKIGQKVIWTGYKIGHFLISVIFFLVYRFHNYVDDFSAILHNQKYICMSKVLESSVVQTSWKQNAWMILKILSKDFENILKACLIQFWKPFSDKLSFLIDATHNFTYIHLSITNEDQYCSAQNIFLMKYFHRSYFHLTT